MRHVFNLWPRDGWGIQSFFSFFDRKFEYERTVINVTVHVEGFTEGICERCFIYLYILLVLETLEAEREEKHALLGQTLASPPLRYWLPMTFTF